MWSAVEARVNAYVLKLMSWAHGQQCEHETHLKLVTKLVWPRGQGLYRVYTVGHGRACARKLCKLQPVMKPRSTTELSLLRLCV